MLGKLIGAIAGSKLSETTRSFGGTTGAIMGVGVATLAKRLSLPALVAITAGGYFAKKYYDRKEIQKLPQRTLDHGTRKPTIAAVPDAA